MSVFENSCYRDDAFQNLVSVISDDLFTKFPLVELLNFTVEEFGNFPVPKGLKPGNLAKQVQLHSVKVQDLHCNLNKDNNPELDIAVTRFLDDVGRVYFGLHGIFRFVSKHYYAIRTYQHGNFMKDKHIRIIYTLGAAASYHTARDANKKSIIANEAIQQHYAPFYKFMRHIFSIIASLTNRKAKKNFKDTVKFEQRLPVLDKQISSFFSKFEITMINNVLFLKGAVSGDLYVFTKGDITRLERMLLGIGSSLLYGAIFNMKDPEVCSVMYERINNYVEILMETMRKISKDDSNHLCRACDIIYHTFIAESFTDVNDWARREQYRKWEKEGYSRFIDKERVLNNVRDLGFKGPLEILLTYKIIPNADYDYYGAAFRQMKLYESSDDSFEKAEDEETGPYSDFVKYYKWQMIILYHKRHKKCPGMYIGENPKASWERQYPHCDPYTINFREIDKVDFTGTFKYDQHGIDLLDLVKDKAICPINIAEIANSKDLQRVDINKKTQLLDVLNANEPYDLTKLKSDNVFYDVKADDKAEAKKPNGRWFFEAHTGARLLQSEYEMNIAKYVKLATGVVSGKRSRELIELMNFVTKPVVGEYERGVTPVYISFDLEKFSPKLDIRWHKMSDALWANAFGYEDIKNRYKIFETGNIHYLKGPIHHTFKKPGRDFEGFAARKNTFNHLVTMGYCVRRAKELGLINSGGRFATLIDDGLLRVDIKIDEVSTFVPKFMNLVDKIYKMMSMKISYDKTYISTKLAIFLNQIKYVGTSVNPGIRAFQKIKNMSEQFCSSILDDLGILESTSRGAIAAGANTTTVYALYCALLLDIIQKWSNSKFDISDRLVIALFAPVALGGFGARGMTELEGSVATNNLVEGLGHLRAISNRFKHLEKFCNQIVYQPVKRISDVGNMINDIPIVRDGRVLKYNRVQNYMERYLFRSARFPLLRMLVHSVATVDMEEEIRNLNYDVTLPVEIRTIIQNMTVHTVLRRIVSKVFKNKTAFKLVPLRLIFKAAYANITEAKIVIKEWI